MDPIKKLYHQKRWNDTKQEVIDRDSGRCRECGKLITGRFIVHHKIPANSKNFFELSNLELVCQDCHNRLTFHDNIRSKNKVTVKLLSGGDDLLDYNK